jgi:hypothetical protein
VPILTPHPPGFLLSPILIDGREFPPRQQSNETGDSTNALAGAHQRDVTFCCCDPDRKTKLVVKRYVADIDTVHYRLARWPESRLEHGAAHWLVA